MGAKRKRGRPPGAKFPRPETIADGASIAEHGSVALSELFVPLWLDWPLIGRGTAAKIAEFLHKHGSSGIDELARVKAALAAPVEPDKRRTLTMEWRTISLAFDAPFNVRTLTEWFLRCAPADTVSAGTLSKLVDWARAAKLN